LVAPFQSGNETGGARIAETFGHQGIHCGFDALIRFRISWQSSETQFGAVMSAENVGPYQTTQQDDEQGKQRSYPDDKGSQGGYGIQEKTHGDRELIEMRCDYFDSHFDSRFGVVC
jgi:hypothetical protein